MKLQLRHLFLCHDLCNRESIVCIVSAIELVDENLTDIVDRLSKLDINDAYSSNTEKTKVDY